MSSSSDATTRVVRLPATLNNVVHLAAMLEKLERGGMAPDPGQYRQLVATLSAELLRQSGNSSLPTLLECFPATAELYENLRYESAGLCLSPLDRSVQTEQAARELLNGFKSFRA